MYHDWPRFTTINHDEAPLTILNHIDITWHDPPHHHVMAIARSPASANNGWPQAPQAPQARQARQVARPIQPPGAGICICYACGFADDDDDDDDDV